jgi:hypothetical protein
MTGSEIVNIVVTVGISQLVIDLLSNYFVFKGESYQRVVRSMESAAAKLQRAEIDLKKNENKHQKRYDRTKAEYQQAAADVAKRHFPPTVSLINHMFLLGRWEVGYHSYSHKTWCAMRRWLNDMCLLSPAIVCIACFSPSP